MSYKVNVLSRLTHQKIGEIEKIWSPLIREEVNGIFEFDFEAPIDSNTKNIRDSSIIEVEGEWFNIARIVKTRRNIRFECEHVSYDANYFSVNFKEIEATPYVILSELLRDKSEFTVGIVELDEPDKMYYFAPHSDNMRAALIELANLVGGELIFNRYEVSLVQKRGKNNNQPLKIGENLIDISVNIDTLESYDDKSIEIDMVDLSKIKGHEHLNGIELGDTVRVIDPIVDIDESLRVVYIEYNPFNKTKPSVQIGKVIRDITDYLKEEPEDDEEDEGANDYYLETFKIGDVDCLQLSGVQVDDDDVLPDGVTASLDFMRFEQHQGLNLKLKSRYNDYHITVFIEDKEGNVAKYNWATQKSTLQAMQFPSENMTSLSVMITSKPYEQFDYLNDDLQQFGVKFQRQTLDVLREFRIGDVNCLKLNDVELVYESNLPDDITAEVPYLDPLEGLFIVPKREFKDWYIKVITYDSNNVATEYNWSDIKDTAKEWTLPNENISKIAVIVDEKPPNKFDESKHLRQIFGVQFFLAPEMTWLEEFKIGQLDVLTYPVLIDEPTTEKVIAQVSYESQDEFVGLFLKLKEEYSEAVMTVVDENNNPIPIGEDTILPSGIEYLFVALTLDEKSQYYGLKFVKYEPYPSYWLSEFRIGDIDCLALPGLQMQSADDEPTAIVEYEEKHQYEGFVLRLKEEYKGYRIKFFISYDDGYTDEYDYHEPSYRYRTFPDTGQIALIVSVFNPNNNTEHQYFGVKFAEKVPEPSGGDETLLIYNPDSELDILNKEYQSLAGSMLVGSIEIQEGNSFIGNFSGGLLFIYSGADISLISPYLEIELVAVNYETGSRKRMGEYVFLQAISPLKLHGESQGFVLFQRSFAFNGFESNKWELYVNIEIAGGDIEYDLLEACILDGVEVWIKGKGIKKIEGGNHA